MEVMIDLWYCSSCPFTSRLVMVMVLGEGTAEVATLDVGLQLQSLNQTSLVHLHAQHLLQCNSVISWVCILSP